MNKPSMNKALCDPAAVFDYLHAGGIIAYPTESVFGLGCLPENQSALAEIYRLKGRDFNKACLIVAAEVSQIEDWITLPFPENPQTPTTFLLPASQQAPKHLVHQGKIAIRITHYAPLKALCQRSPLVSTSANPSGYPAARTAAAVRAYFPNITIVAGEVQGINQPSQLIDAITGERLR